LPVKKIENKADCLKKQIFPFIPTSLQNYLNDLGKKTWNKIEEIRLRKFRPLLISVGNKDLFVDSRGALSEDKDHAVVVSERIIGQTIKLLTQSSIYALEEELRRGYITMEGGHRVGIVGRVILDKGKIKSMKQISSLNMRISREIIGAADKILPYIIRPEGNQIYNSLIVSPPGCGKTTLLRDLTRQLSNGSVQLNFRGFNIGVVDERSEIAGTFQGRTQHEVGIRTDILDASPKAEGMMLLIRSMSPEIIVTDELGNPEDLNAIHEVLNAGVKVLSTFHARDKDEVFNRKGFQELFSKNLFERYIILCREPEVGTIKKVLDGQSLKKLNSKPIITALDRVGC